MTAPLSVRFPEHVRALLAETAQREQRSESSVIREAVAAFLADRDHREVAFGTADTSTLKG